MTFSARTPTTTTTNTAATAAAPILYYLTFHLALCPTQEEGEEWNLILLPINFKFIPIITAFLTFSHLRRRLWVAPHRHQSIQIRFMRKDEELLLPMLMMPLHTGWEWDGGRRRMGELAELFIHI